MSNFSHEIKNSEDIICLESEDEDIVCLHSTEEVNRDEMPLDFEIAELEKKLTVHIAQSEDEAYALYQDYANLVGFSVRKGKQYYINGTKVIRSKTYLCSKEGVKDERPRSKGTRTQHNSRTQCKAMITFDVDKDGLWKVTKFVKDHNHELASSTSKHLLRSARFISAEKRAAIESMKNAGLRPIDCFNYVTEECHGVQHVGFSKKDCYNFINMLKAALIEPGDAQNLVRYFKSKVNIEPGFYFDIQFNQEGRMANVFWRDDKSRLDYDCFGDLVIFDTTYRTNRYDLVCAPFIGVNHHWQNVMFGCAFLSDETTSSFNWLFNTFLESMGSRAPSSIFTDQDQAMANAIADVFPVTRHRLCLWHISKNAPSHLNSLNSSREFHSFFNKCLYHCETKEEFEQTWEEMIHNYNAQDHRWLSNLYKIREKWSPAFNSDFFHGGVRSTSRSESTNHALNEISTKTISLSEFVLKFEKDLLGKWRRNEADADFFSSQSTPTLAVNSKLLKHAVRIYTNTMYKEFEKAYLNGTGALSCKEIPVGDTLYEFELTNSESYNDRVYTVFLDINTLKVECSCNKIHWMGMLCSHALAALHRKNVHEIPQAYIHNRWTKDVKKHAYIMDEYESTRIDGNEARVLYTSRAMRFAYDLITQSESCKEARDIMWTVLKDGARSLDEFYKKKNIDSTSSMKDKFVTNYIVELHKDKPILDPLRAKPKGTRNRRIKNHFEKRKPKIPLTDTKRKTKKRVESTSRKAHVPASSGPVSDIQIPSQSMNSGFIDVTRYQHVHQNSNHVLNVMPQTPSLSKEINIDALSTQVPWSSTPLVEISTPSQSFDSSVCKYLFGVVPEMQWQSPSFAWTMNKSPSFTSMMQSYNQINNPTQDSQSSDWRSTAE